MRVDLLAGTAYNPAVMPSPVPTILVFDSGLGGLTVFSEVLKARPDARYRLRGGRCGLSLWPARRGRPSSARVLAVMERLIALHDPDTRGDRLQHRLDPRAAASAGAVLRCPSSARSRRSSRRLRPRRPGMITVLATPGTVARDYTRDLIETYAAGCRVNLVGSRRLAGFAEAELAGDPVSDAELLGRDRALLRRGRRRAHRCGGARLHPLSAAAAAPRGARALAGHLDRPGAGHRPAGGAADRPARSRATRPTRTRPWPCSPSGGGMIGLRSARRPCAEQRLAARSRVEAMPLVRVDRA